MGFDTAVDKTISPGVKWKRLCLTFLMAVLVSPEENVVQTDATCCRRSNAEVGSVVPCYHIERNEERMFKIEIVLSDEEPAHLLALGKST